MQMPTEGNEGNEADNSLRKPFCIMAEHVTER
jgi:hypothetical protein